MEPSRLSLPHVPSYVVSIIYDLYVVANKAQATEGCVTEDELRNFGRAGTLASYVYYIYWNTFVIASSLWNDTGLVGTYRGIEDGIYSKASRHDHAHVPTRSCNVNGSQCIAARGGEACLHKCIQRFLSKSDCFGAVTDVYKAFLLYFYNACCGCERVAK